MADIMVFPAAAVEKNEVLNFVGYNEFEKAADDTALKIKEGFMKMGYILKMARDTDILVGSGYANHEDFAARRYDLDKGTVSRYIRIVERFSVDGNSHLLKENYRTMGFAKLSLMLHMPDAIAEELMDSLSKQEVLAIKEELDEEGKISDIELAIEKADAEAEETEEDAPAAVVPETMLQKAVYQLGKEQPTLYCKIFDFVDKDRARELFGVIAPQGEAIYMPRIVGVGRLMISITDTGVSVTNVRLNEKERYSKDELLDALRFIVDGTAEDAKISFKRIYREEFPQEEPENREVAPVQPKKEKRKDSKVTKAKPKAPAPRPQAAEQESANNTDEEEQLPGQINIADIPGVVPEETEENENEIRTDADNITGMSEGAGTAGDAVEPAADAGVHTDTAETVPAGESYEGDGAAASGGCEADYGTGEADYWIEVHAAHNKLNQYLTVWNNNEPLMEDDVLKKLYTEAINLAAGIEKVMRARGGRE